MKSSYLISLGLLIITMFVRMHAQEPMKEILSDYQFDTQYTMLGDLEIAYIHEGVGPKTIILVHGLSSNSDAWSKNIPVLSECYQVIAIDLPGFGKSTKQNNLSYTPSFYADIVKGIADKFRLDKFYLAGHSMGGHVAIKFATKYPKRLSKLILVAPAGIEQFNDNQINIIKNFLTFDYIKNTGDAQIEKNYKMNFYQMPDEVHQMIQDRIKIRKATDFDEHANAIVQSVHGMLDEPVFDDLKSINPPTLIIYGKNDQLIPNRLLNPNLTTEKIGAIVKETIPNNTLIQVQRAGHFVMFEQNDFVNEVIMTFLKK